MDQPAVAPTKRSGKRTASPKRDHRLSAAAYAVSALVAFVVGCALLAFLIIKSREIGGAGLTGQVYYAVLLAMAVAIAFALFGMMRARASVSGKAPNLSVELGGAAAMFALVVVGGFKLVPQVDAFSFAVLLRTANGAPAASGGVLTMLVGGAPMRRVVDEDGRALFENLPAPHRGQTLRLELNARGWRFGNDRVDTTITLAGTNALVAVTPSSTVCCVSGRVRDESGAAVVGATVSVDGTVTRTDSTGWFKLTLAPARRGESVRVQVSRRGYRLWDSTVPVDTAAVDVILQSAR